jgi:hypothetical protein
MAKSMGPQSSPSEPLPGSGIARLSCITTNGTSSTTAVTSTQRR